MREWASILGAWRCPGFLCQPVLGIGLYPLGELMAVTIPSRLVTGLAARPREWAPLCLVSETALGSRTREEQQGSGKQRRGTARKPA